MSRGEYSVAPKKGRGRPKGATNKVKQELPEPMRLFLDSSPESPLVELKERFTHQRAAEEAALEGKSIQQVEDSRFAQLVGHGMGVEEASNIVGFSYITGYRRLKEKHVIEEVAAVKKELTEKLVRKMQRAGHAAVENLISLMTDGEAPHSVRLNATLALLDRIGLSPQQVGEKSGDRVVVFETNFTLNQGAAADQQQRAALVRRQMEELPATVEGEFTPLESNEE